MKISALLIKALSELPDSGLEHSSPFGPMGGMDEMSRIKESALMQYVMGRDEVWQWVFDALNRRGCIEQNPATKRWTAAKSSMEAWDPPQGHDCGITPAEALEVLRRHERTGTDAGVDANILEEWPGLQYTAWRKIVGDEHPGGPVVIRHWSFYHVITSLIEGKLVFKFAGTWRVGSEDVERKRFLNVKADELKKRAEDLLAGRETKRKGRPKKVVVEEDARFEGKIGLLTAYPSSTAPGKSFASVFGKASQSCGAGKRAFERSHADLLARGFIAADATGKLWNQTEEGMKQYQASIPQSRESRPRLTWG